MSTVRQFCKVISLAIILAFASVTLIASGTHAAEGEFYLQVSPSPLVATLKPGQKSTLSVKIRNAGTQSEKLKIEPRSFKVTNDGNVELNDTQTPEIARWLHFSSPEFSIEPGQTYEQKVDVDVPKDAGFSYSFALMITRQQTASPMFDKGQELKGKVAIFALLTIDKPGATRELKLETITSDAKVYEYLPATITIRLKNTGNTITQPSGNLFIQRKSADKEPLDTLNINDSGGYILPDTTRDLTIKWANGFPAVKQNNEQKDYLDWNWENLANFRIGYYTAKAVVVYNDGHHDVPIVADVGFWVIPWKILLGLLLVLVLLLFGVWSLISKALPVRKRKQSVHFRKR
jgi:hypothetical protein